LNLVPIQEAKFTVDVVMGSVGAGEEVDVGAVDIEAEPDIDGVGRVWDSIVVVEGCKFAEVF